ncbi:hypothetical protein C0Q70_10400 [Pomacea canaliculata]|uniref:Reelin domain-containing protein n=1 Tax=Pomacea canaliculata TaxID=400727 RepID=A0A2T7PCI7_POMCA|nr:hypothetical protein C0Q70_10400 [Pomacea canaliculata]
MSDDVSKTLCGLEDHGFALQHQPFKRHLLTWTEHHRTDNHPLAVQIVTTNSSHTFRGFQVAVHRVLGSNNSQELLGTFSTNDNTTQLVTCVGEPKKMFGHAVNINRTVATATWTAPAQNAGDVEFQATVVESFSVIWYGIKTKLRAAPGISVTQPQNIVPPLTIQQNLPDWGECGKSKGCFLHPLPGNTRCVGDDCQAAVSYRQNGDLFTFEMSAAGQDSYLAIGFSDDELMGDDQVIVCTAIPEHQSIQLSYNPEKYTYRQYTMGMSNLATRQVNGRVYCTFTRRAELNSTKNDGSPRPFDLGTNSYFIFLAWGNVGTGTDVMTKHIDSPAVSVGKVNLRTVTVISKAPPALSPASSCCLLVSSIIIIFVMSTLQKSFSL